MYQITVFACGRPAFYLRKADGGLTTKTAGNQMKPTFSAYGGDIGESKLVNKSVPEKALINMRIV